MSVKNDFKTLYYRTANCLTSDIIADMNPVSRILGVDTSAGFGTVFTAIGSRFDIRFVAKEAFMATENYESDTRSVDGVSVSEVMRYVRAETIAENALPKTYIPFVDAVKKGESVYRQYHTVQTGVDNAEILFLMSPAHVMPEKAATQFTSVVDKLGKSALCTNVFGDCGYLKLQLGLVDSLDTEKLKKALEDYIMIVTDDQFILDAVLIQFPELTEKVLFIDEFLFQCTENLNIKASGKIMLHESGTIQRLYPTRKICYHKLLSGADIITSERSGYDTTDSGLAGGLGLAEPQIMLAIASRRMEDLTAAGADVIITPCACEATGLNCTEKAYVSTLLEYVTSV